MSYPAMGGQIADATIVQTLRQRIRDEEKQTVKRVKYSWGLTEAHP